MWWYKLPSSLAPCQMQHLVAEASTKLPSRRKSFFNKLSKTKKITTPQGCLLATKENKQSVQCDTNCQLGSCAGSLGRDAAAAGIWTNQLLRFCFSSDSQKEPEITHGGNLNQPTFAFNRYFSEIPMLNLSQKTLILRLWFLWDSESTENCTWRESEPIRFCLPSWSTEIPYRT